METKGALGMIKNYSQHIYTNPFRNQRTKSNEFEIIKDLKKKFEPFFSRQLSEINEYFDEFNYSKDETYLLRSIRNTLKDHYDSLIERTKSNFITKEITNNCIKHQEKLKSVNNYQNNLRLLELPLQPLVDKEGFEIQSLSNDILEGLLEEIDTGISYIYDYCASILPESVDLWEDYAILNQKDFPIISHDFLLEGTYRSFDKVFNKIQKGAINTSNWVISGDINSRVLNIVKPKIDIEDFTYLFKTLLESFICLILVTVILTNILKKLKPFLQRQRKALITLNPIKIVRKVRKTLGFKKFRVKQRIRQLESNLNLLNFNVNVKYKLLQLIVNKSGL